MGMNITNSTLAFHLSKMDGLVIALQPSEMIHSRHSVSRTLSNIQVNAQFDSPQANDQSTYSTLPQRKHRILKAVSSSRP